MFESESFQFRSGYNINFAAFYKVTVTKSIGYLKQ